MKVSLCIFANFFIDNPERLQRMKDSFLSFKDINPNEWKVNIRGSLKFDAGNFLQDELGKKISVSYIKTNKGWFKDSYTLVKNIKSEYIFFWIEDHICLVSPIKIEKVMIEMKKFNVDLLHYSLFNSDTWGIFNLLPITNDGKYIRVCSIDEISGPKVIKARSRNFYVVSAVCIFEKNFFFKVLLSNRPLLKRHSKFLPYDFEKKFIDNVANKISTAIPKEELFASIDTTYIKGYSLIERGLYPDRFSQLQMKELELYPSKNKLILYFKKNAPEYLRKPIENLYYFIKRIIYTLEYFL